MNARIDLTGNSYGRWTVLRHTTGKKWLCRCQCGTERDIDGGSLRAGRSTGCINCHTAGLNTTHGGKRTRLYNIWCKMIARCERPSDAAYHRYGGRGIAVWSEWRESFSAFREWAEREGYAEHLTIDRINGAGNYEPSNCRWATQAEQNRNTSRNRPVEYNGRTLLVCDLAAEVGLPQDILKNRIFRYGWSVEEAVTTPVLPKGGRR